MAPVTPESDNHPEALMKPSPPSVWHSLPAKVALIGVYLVLNMTLNMTNKWVFSIYQFRFPLLLSIAHMAFSFLALAPLMATKGYRELHLGTLSKQWVGLMGVGLFFATNLGFNNVSLLSMTLSLNQVIRATIPVVTAVVAVFIEAKRPSRQEFLSLCLLCFGVCIAVYEGSGTSSSVTGISICVLGTISNGLMMSVIGKLVSEKLDVLRLTFYSAPITCLVLVPFHCMLEWKDLVVYTKTHDQGYLLILLLGSINALMYNVAHTLVIKVTSSVTTTVLGEMKIILILILSSVLLGEGKDWTFKMLLGCTLAILGFCAYSHCKMLSSTNQPQWTPVIKGVPELSGNLSSAASSAAASSSGGIMMMSDAAGQRQPLLKTKNLQ